MNYRLRGFDTFEGADYNIDGTYPTEEKAIEAAKAYLKQLERTQPSATSGGQGFGGIQDRVYVVRPDGSSFRVMGVESRSCPCRRTGNLGTPQEPPQE